MSSKNDLKNETDVLIVGAGPTGLMMACQLAFHGVNCRIIDKKNRQTNYSGALLIQARTLELLDQLGLAEKALQKGQIAEKVSLIHNGKLTLELDIGNMGLGASKFPFILMLTQTYTEELLIEYLDKLGIHVERNTTLIEFSQNEQTIQSQLLNAEEKTEIVRSKYLIGSDGSYSHVRELLNISWHGKTTNTPLFVADCHVEKIPENEIDNTYLPLSDFGKEIIFSISDNGIAGFFSLKNGNWRIDSVIPNDMKNNKDFSFAEVVQDFASRIKMNVKLHNPHWFSVFYPNTFLAERFSKNRCFLVGDAAHVHTPIGAQGMNTGIQDSYNLAWKLAFVIKNGVSDKLLETYSTERKRIASQLIRTTDRYFGIAINTNSTAQLMRTRIIPWVLRSLSPLLRLNVLKRAFFRGISQINLHYKTKNHTRFNPFKSRSPLPGERWPYFRLSDESAQEYQLQEKVSGKSFVLFCFAKDKQELSGIQSKLHKIQNRYPNLLAFEIINYSDHTYKLYHKLGIKNSGYYLVRPDGYVALQNKNLLFDPLQQYLEKLF